MHRDGLADVAQLIEQRLVDLQAAGGVEDDDVAVETLGLGDAALAELRHLRLAVGDRHRDLVVGAELLELLHRGRAADVGRDEHRTVAVAPDRERELRRGGRLARALQADEHEHGRRMRLVLDLALLTAEQRDQLLVDDLHDLLPGRQRFEHVTADRALADPVDERAGDAEVDVGLEQRHAHLAQADLDVLLGQAAAAGEAPERRGQAVAECFEDHQAVTVAIAGAQLGLDAVPPLHLGRVAEALLEVLELRKRAADQVVRAAARALQVLGELGERPVLVEVQPAGLTLVLGEQRAVDVEQPLLRRRARRAARGVARSVKGKALTCYNRRAGDPILPTRDSPRATGSL